MTEKTKNIVVTIVFNIIIFGIFFINILKTPTDISTSERRKLAQFPDITLERIGNTDFMDDFASYVLDQFVARDMLRSVKAKFLFDVLHQKDNNGIYIVNGHASKILSDLKEGELKQTVKNINRLYRNYLTNGNVYYSVIPDKNYFLAEANGYPHINYSKFMQVIDENINSEIKYIDIYDTLDIEDYYTTDIHWRQEKIEKVANQLLVGMNRNPIHMQYDRKEMYPFYGTYYGQSALPLEAEKLYYLTNENLASVKVKILNEKTFEMEEKEMYDIASFTGIDPYNLFLSGPKAIIELENPKATTEKELILFRDSFGSSLAPLLSSEYAKITLIDLRYIASPILKNVVEFKEGQDVLIIYSTEVFNNGSILKIM